MAVLGGSRPAAAESASSSLSEAAEVEQVLYAVADTTLRADDQHTNEGANPRLRVSSESNVVMAFDRSDTLDSIQAGSLVRVSLVLRIAETNNNWGPRRDRSVAIWPLLPSTGDFVEGNGRQLGISSGAVRATGPGATWHLATDLDCENDVPDSESVPSWQGATTVQATPAPSGPLVVHSNSDSGEVRFDVTQDVLTHGAYAWRLGLGPIPRRAPGEDPQLPSVDYYSKEGASEAGQPSWAPRLIVTVTTPDIPDDPGGGPPEDPCPNCEES
jgi:hypothetical protein